jgi:hypothetical protein
MSTRSRRTMLTAALVGAGLALISGGSGEAPAPARADASSEAPAATTYVGRVAGTRALIGLIEDGRRIRAYVCDSRTIASWFLGSLRNGRAALTATVGRARLTLALSRGRAEGAVTIAARRHRFVALPATGKAGLYRGTLSAPDGSPLAAGGIVLPSGAKAGAVVRPGTAAPLPGFTPPATIDRIHTVERPG